MSDEPDAVGGKNADLARAKRRPAPEIDGQVVDANPPTPVSPLSIDPLASPDTPVHPAPAPSEPPAVDPAVVDAASSTSTPRHSEAKAGAAAEPNAPFAADETGPSAIAPPPQKRGFILPLVAGLLLGAAGSVGGAYALRALGIGAADADTPRLDALARRLDETDRKLAAASAAAAAPAAALVPRVDALAKKVDALPPPPNTSALDTRLAALEKTVAAAGTDKTPPVDLGPLTERLGALDRRVASLPTAADVAARTATPPKLAGDLAALSGKLDGLAGRLTPLEALAAPKSDVRAAQDPDAVATSQATRGPALAAVAADLARRIPAGRPFDEDLTILTTLAADPAKLARLKPLAAGVTSAADLAAQFGPLAAPILAAGEPPARDEGFFAHLERSAGALVRVQKVDGSDGGSDLPARVARLQAQLLRGDVLGALATWKTLPETAKAKSQAWGRAADAHVEALTVAQALAADAVALIGKGRS